MLFYLLKWVKSINQTKQDWLICNFPLCCLNYLSLAYCTKKNSNYKELPTRWSQLNSTALASKHCQCANELMSFVSRRTVSFWSLAGANAHTANKAFLPEAPIENHTQREPGRKQSNAYTRVLLVICGPAQMFTPALHYVLVKLQVQNNVSGWRTERAEARSKGKVHVSADSLSICENVTTEMLFSLIVRHCWYGALYFERAVHFLQTSHSQRVLSKIKSPFI